MYATCAIKNIILTFSKMFRQVLLLIVFTSFWGLFTIGYAQEANESNFLHVLIVADTVDRGVGKSVEKDVKMLKNLFEEGIPESKRKITILADDFLTPEALFESIEKLNVADSDSLLFYFCGHGVIDKDENHLFNLPTGQVLRSKVLDAIQRKKPRLCVLLSDCCAAIEPPFRWMPAPHFKTYNSELLRYLFFCPEGLVDINSAKPGEVALCSDMTGGYFTDRFTQVFLLPTSAFISSQDSVPTWNTVLDKITELLIPTEMEVQRSQRIGEAPYLLEMEKSRGIRVFRDKKEPNRPVQHPIAFSELPAPTFRPFPTGDNSLGFTYHIIPDSAIQVDEVVPGSTAQWNGLENGDSILGFEEQLFAIVPGEDETMPAQAIKARASRLDQNFDFDECLLAPLPIGTYMPNVTPGWIKAVVRKRSGNTVSMIPVSTSRPPVKKDLTKLTPEDAEELFTPYFERLQLPATISKQLSFSRLFSDGSVLLVWSHDRADGKKQHTFERVKPDGSRDSLYEEIGGFGIVDNAVIDVNDNVYAFFKSGQQILIREGKTAIPLPNEVSKVFFFPDQNIAALVSETKRLIVFFDYVKGTPATDKVIQGAAQGRFIIQALPETGQILTVDDVELTLWNIKDCSKAMNILVEKFLPKGAFPSDLQFLPSTNLLVFTLFSDEGPQLEIWRLESSGKRVQMISGHFRNPLFNANGTRMLAQLDDATVLWDTKTWKSIGTIRGGGDQNDSYVFSPDGKSLAGISKGWYGEAAMLWDADTGRFLKNLGTNGKTPPRLINFTSDGKSVSIFLQEGSIQTIDLK